MESEGVLINEVTKGPILPFLNVAEAKEFHFDSLLDYFISALASTSFISCEKSLLYLSLHFSLLKPDHLKQTKRRIFPEHGSVKLDS